MNQTASKVFNVPQPPSDTVSKIAWFPSSNNSQTFMAAASWDKTLRLWDVRNQNSTNVQIEARTMFTLDAPILSCCFSRQNALFSAGCDNLVKAHNLTTGQSQIVGKHDAPISCVAFDDEQNICITGSWDGSIRFWDCRQSNPIHTTLIPSNAKVYSLDFKNPTLLLIGSDKRIRHINMKNFTAPPTVFETLLKLQLRSVALQPDQQAYAVTSIEGRCNITYFDESTPKNKRFTFKCHRSSENGVNKVYPVNCSSFCPAHPSCLFTAGSDGIISVWEIRKRVKLRDLEKLNAPMTDISFDTSGQLLAYAASYDWHKGCNGFDHSKVPRILSIRTILPSSLEKV